MSVDRRRAAAELDSRGGGGLRSDAVPAAAPLVALDLLPLSAPTQVRRSFRGSARAPLASRHFPFQKTGSSKDTRASSLVFSGHFGDAVGRDTAGMSANLPRADSSAIAFEQEFL